MGIQCIDMYSIFIQIVHQDQSGLKESIFTDGLHFTAEGSSIVASSIARHLKEATGIAPDLLPSDLPCVTTLDFEFRQVAQVGEGSSGFVPPR